VAKRRTRHEPEPDDPAKSVFINCPFDDDFRPMLRAMVFTIRACNYVPRCALDKTDGAEVRIAKIATMIRECDWCIHDLSRVEVTGGLPRFNMSMELGLHLGASLFGRDRQRRKRALILDAVPHRYDQSLSDISGQDIEIHGNDPNEVIRCVRNWLSDNRPHNASLLPGADAIQTDYRRFKRDVVRSMRARKINPKRATHSDFLWFVRDWIETRAPVLLVPAKRSRASNP
jgi:hypothetical protein